MKQLLLIGLLVLVACSAPEEVKVDIDVPITAEAGSDFNFTVTVQNTDDKTHELRSIDIDETFLEGVFVVSTSEDLTDEYTVFGFHVFEFKKNIPANSDLTVTFNARAVKEGDFSGDVDICIDGDAKCTSRVTRILIE